MPPHCDSLDGPVVAAARQALEQGDVSVALPYVHEQGEQEVRDAFHRAVRARALGPEAREVADRWFFETVVRVDRAGEGAPFTGLKPAGLDVGPVIPAAGRAIESGSSEPPIDALSTVVREQIERRHRHVMQLNALAGKGVPEARAYVEAMLGLQVWAHRVYRQALTDPATAHEHV